MSESNDGYLNDHSAPDPIDAVVARFEASDAAREASDEGAGDDGHDEHEDEQGTDDRSSDDAGEHPTADTESATDGSADETADDSAEEEDDDDASDDDDDQGTESGDDEGDDASESGEEQEDGEQDTIEDTKAALEQHGADLSLDDIPAEFRPLVEKKLKGIDAAFTRYAQEATAFRAEQAQFRTDARYRAEHPELVIVELLQQGGAELMERVNAQLDQLEGDDATVATARQKLDEAITEARKQAEDAVKAEADDFQRRLNRADEVERYARDAATKIGLPFGKTLERAIAAEILAKPEEKRAEGLSNAEIDAIVADFAKEHAHLVRQGKREQSRAAVRTRSAVRRAPAATVQAPRGVASPTTGKPPQKKVNVDNEEERLAAMERTAERLFRQRRAR